MRVGTFTVHNGLVDLRSDTIEEGSLVTVDIPDHDVFALTPEEEADLAAAMEEADRGDLVADTHVRALLAEALHR